MLSLFIWRNCFQILFSFDVQGIYCYCLGSGNENAKSLILLYCLTLHQGLVLRPSFLPEKVDVNQKSINQKYISIKK